MHSRHSEAPHVARAPGRSYFDPAGSCTSSILSSIGHRSRPTPLALQFTDGPLCARKPGRRFSLESPSVPLGPKHGKIELDFRQFLQIVDGNDSFVVDISSAIGNDPSGAAIAGSLFRHLLLSLSLSLFYLLRSLSSTVSLTLFFFSPLRALLSLANTLNRSLLLHLCNCASLARSLSRRSRYNFYLCW